MSANTDILTVIRSEGSALIRQELREMDQRQRLERAVLDAIHKYGCTVDEVSAASGLAPADIYRMLDKPPELEDIDVLAGIA